MNAESIIACDDGIVNKLDQKYTIIACTLYNIEYGPLHIGFLPVKIDGLDATSQILHLSRILYLQSETPVSGILLDSLTIAGFNIVSPSMLYNQLNLPVIVIYKRKPRYNRIVTAVTKHLSYPEVRLRVLKLLEKPEMVITKKGKLYIVRWGIDSKNARDIIEKLQLYSRIPEPLRFIDYFASAVSRLLLPI